MAGDPISPIVPLPAGLARPSQARYLGILSVLLVVNPVMPDKGLVVGEDLPTGLVEHAREPVVVDCPNVSAASC